MWDHTSLGSGNWLSTTDPLSLWLEIEHCAADVKTFCLSQMEHEPWRHLICFSSRNSTFSSVPAVSTIEHALIIALSLISISVIMSSVPFILECQRLVPIILRSNHSRFISNWEAAITVRSGQQRRVFRELFKVLWLCSKSIGQKYVSWNFPVCWKTLTTPWWHCNFPIPLNPFYASPR